MCVGDVQAIKAGLEVYEGCPGAEIDSIDRSSDDRRQHVTALMRAAGGGHVMAMVTLVLHHF